MNHLVKIGLVFYCLFLVGTLGIAQDLMRYDSLLQTIGQGEKRINVASLRTQLYDDETTVILYKIEGKKVEIIGLNKEDVFYEVQIDSIGLSEKIKTFRNALKNGNARAKEGAELYAFLFPKKIENSLINKDRIVIVPAGALYYLPFEALPINGTDFLIERYAISFISDPVNWCFGKQYSPDLKIKYTGFSPSYSRDVLMEVDQLTAYEDYWESAEKTSDAEVRKIATSLTGNTFVGERATETLFKTSSTGNRMFQYKGIVFLNEDQVEKSGFAFAAGNDDDSFLNFKELEELNPSNEFFFLSANFYKKGNQEGAALKHLMQILEQSENQSCLLSLWQAEKMMGSKQIHAFIRELESGVPRDIAWQNARKKLLETMDENFVFQMNYQFYGKVNPLQPFGIGIPWYWMFGGVFVLVLILMYRKGKAKYKALEEKMNSDD